MNNLTNRVLLLVLMAALLAVTREALAQNNAPAAPRPVAPPASAPGPAPVVPVEPQPDWVTKIFELKYADAGQMKSILSIFRADLVVPNVQERDSGRMRIVSVHAPKEIMPAIEDTIARFDVPPPPQPVRTPVKSVELSVQVLGAYDGTAPTCANCTIPPSLQPVITQLQKTFSYKNYLLLDSQLYRQADRTSLSGTNSLAGMTDSSATYSIAWASAVVSPDKSFVQLNSLKFGAEVWMQARPQSTHFGFDTSQVQIPADQQIVIGKTTVGTTTVFLVIQAKVLD